MFGMVRNVQTCPDCNGTGKIIKDKCPCLPWNRIYFRTKEDPGIYSGGNRSMDRASVSVDKGEPGTNGGPRGDLLVEVNVARHPIFQRQDMNIFSTAPHDLCTGSTGW